MSTWLKKTKKKVPFNQMETDESLFVQSEEGVLNPLQWDTLPEFIQKKCPKWKDEEFSRSMEPPRTNSESKEPDSDSKQNLTHSTSEETPLESPSLYQAKSSCVDSRRLSHTCEYIVRPGDTINSVALRFDMTANQFTYLNRLELNRVIHPGQVVTVVDPNRRTPLKTVQKVVSTPLEEEEEKRSHILSIQSKQLTNELGCVKGVLYFYKEELIFSPNEDDPLIREQPLTDFSSVIPMNDVIYAAIVKDCDQLDLPTDTGLKSILWNHQPPIPLPGRPVRETPPTTPKAATHSVSSEVVARKPEMDSFTEEVFAEAYDSGFTEPGKPCEGENDVVTMETSKRKEGDTCLEDISEATSEKVPGRQRSAEGALNTLLEGDGKRRRPVSMPDFSSSTPPSDRPEAAALGLGMLKYLKIKVSHPTLPCPVERGVSIPGSPTRSRRDLWFTLPDDKVHHVVAFFTEHHSSIKLHHTHQWEDGCFVMVDVDGDNALTVSSNHYSWENISWKDIPVTIPSMDMDDDLPLPPTSEPATLLSEPFHRELMNFIPSRAVGLPWELGYSSFRDGYSLSTLYRKMAEYDDCPTVLIVKDTSNSVFGAGLPCTIKRSEHYYGSGESFLYQLVADSGKLQIYQWTGENDFVVQGGKEGFMIGGGEGHCGLWICEDLLNGSSYPCKTFANEPLATETDFQIIGIELWCIVTS